MTCIIIEDEIPAQRIVQHYISKIPVLKLLGSYQSALAANSILSTTKIDIIFLDINLPDISGIQYVRTLSNPPNIIITTAYHEHAVESFELDTICDYLVKPFSLGRFLKAINKVKRQINPETTKNKKEIASEEVLFINIDKTLHKIKITDISYIESDKNYVTIVTQNGSYSYLESLKNWLLKLPEKGFIQVHKSYIINYHQIEKINGNILYLKHKKIPIGRRYKAALIKKLKIT